MGNTPPSTIGRPRYRLSKSLPPSRSGSGTSALSVATTASIIADPQTKLSNVPRRSFPIKRQSAVTLRTIAKPCLKKSATVTT